MKPRARVSVTYELNAKAAPHLEALLRELVPAQISCVFIGAETTVLEETKDDEQVSRQPYRERKADRRAGDEQQGERSKPGAGDARKDGIVARIARKVAGKK